MSTAVRAIVIENGKILVMYRDKNGSCYHTLVGGSVEGDEPLTNALIREVDEETGLLVTHAKHVFTEKHAPPYNEQVIFLCKVANHNEVAVQSYSEEGQMNALGMNIHAPIWVPISSFGSIAFRTPQLQQAILEALKKGFPKEPIQL